MDSDVTVAHSAWLKTEDGETIPVTSPFKLGRSSRCSLKVDSEKASREHCLFQHDPTTFQWWLTDLQSTNGTYLNGRRLTSPTRIAHDDTVTIGGRSWTFGCEELDAAEFAPTEVGETFAAISSVTCWFLIADVIGSTRLSQELPAAGYAIKLKEWISLMEEVVEGNKGFINEYMGDGILAVWDSRSNQAVDRFCDALVAFREAQKKSPFPYRVIAHYGTAQMGGGKSSGVERLAGSEINFVFKSEKVVGNLPFRTILSESAVQAVDGLLAFEELGSYAIPGFEKESLFFALK